MKRWLVLERLVLRRSFRWRSGTAGLSDIAALVHRLAVLLAAGVAPTAAWRHAARAPLESAGASVAGAAARAGPGAIPDAIAEVAGGAGGAGVAGSAGTAGPVRAAGLPATRANATQSAWTGLAATWSVSASAGAPLAPTLRAYAELLRGFAVAERDTRIALAGPRATSRLVLVLPLVAIAFGALLGQDTIGVLVGTPLGWGCLVVGLGLGLAGWAWTRRLLRSAAPTEQLPGLAEELTAVAMSGGVSVERAKQLVARALTRYRLTVDRAHADAALALAAASGAPAGELLRAEAQELRRDAVANARERAERLSVSLMLPLGICVLPAFIAVGVIPLMAAVIGSTLEHV